MPCLVLGRFQLLVRFKLLPAGSKLTSNSWCLTPFELQRKERVFAMCERYSAAMEDHDMMKIIEALPEPQTNGKS